MAGAVPVREGVVIACRRVGDGRWLMVRRAGGLTRSPHAVGFPGGEVEPGETREGAVVREAWEELGIEVKPVRCVWRHEWSERGWLLWGWLAEMRTSGIRPNREEVAEVMWLSAEEGMAHPDALPTMRPLCEALASAGDGR